MKKLSRLLCVLAGTFTAVSTTATEHRGTPAFTKSARSIAQDAVLATRMAADLQRVEAADADAPKMRGAHETQLFERTSPAVVLIFSLDERDHANGLGSGSVLNADGQILTNMHVVEGADRVAVVFKPRSGSVDINDIPRANLFTARVEKLDQERDLALLRLESHPANLTTLSMGTLDSVSIGADVHAIGHPEGATWSYTKGIVSQIRQNAEWSYSDDRRKHHATVIQTQTPINPGNSGGPLINDAMQLVGVNTYSRSDAQGMNYAVSVDEVKRFIAEPARATPPRRVARAENAEQSREQQPGKQRRPQQQEEDNSDRKGPNMMPREEAGSGKRPDRRAKNDDCQPRFGNRERDAGNDGWRTEGDYNCSGQINSYKFEWDDAARGQSLHIDRNGDGKMDAVYYDQNRDGKAEQADFDTHYSGHFDVRVTFDVSTGQVVQSMRLGR